MRVAGVVLAGGRSSRMGGRDKALLPLRGKPLLAWAIQRLAPQVEGLAVNSNSDPAHFDGLGFPVIPDVVPGYAGPLAGILSGLDWAAPTYEAVVTVAVDTPFFPLDLVTRLGGTPTCKNARSGSRTHPVFALWPTALIQPLRLFLADGGTGRVMTFLESIGCRPVDFPFHDLPSGLLDPFFNINTPGDLAHAEAVAAELS